MRRGKILAGLGAFLILGSSLYVGVNTNLLGPSELCHGLTQESTVQDVFSGGGRLSSEDSSGLSCTVSRSSVGAEGGDTAVELRLVGAENEYPFERALWKATGQSSVFTRNSSGVVDEGGGWVILPSDCKVKNVSGVEKDPERAVVKAIVTEGSEDIDLLGMARMLGEVGHGIALRNGCDADSIKMTPDVNMADPVKVTDFGNVCSLEGLEIPRLETEYGRALEYRSGDLKSSWFCDLSFEKSPYPGAEGVYPYTRFAVVQDQVFASGAAREDHGFKKVAECSGEETYFLMDSVDFPWTPEERSDAGLPSEGDLFSLFVAAAADAMGCRSGVQ